MRPLKPCWTIWSSTNITYFVRRPGCYRDIRPHRTSSVQTRLWLLVFHWRFALGTGFRIGAERSIYFNPPPILPLWPASPDPTTASMSLFLQSGWFVLCLVHSRKCPFATRISGSSFAEDRLGISRGLSAHPQRPQW